ncbi:hypothetical protein MKY25_15140 [Geobacillus sp. FSL W8-0032]|uniref:hypothetical protein n=1 Tax=Geobacillus TaxID=129337 RepID=UPI0005045F13|nr:hypothetical protein [Geobacillus icigianus]
MTTGRLVGVPVSASHREKGTDFRTRERVRCRFGCSRRFAAAGDGHFFVLGNSRSVQVGRLLLAGFLAMAGTAQWHFA